MKEHILKPLLTEEEVDLKIRELAARISEDYAGKQLHLIGVLKGSVPFMAELAKRLTIPATMDFMSCSSYGGGTSSSGVVRLNKDLDESIEGRDVLLVEDIIDTGHTLSYLLNLLQDRKPASLKLAALLDKPSRRTCPVEVNYTCFKIPDVFVVGYGLDYDQLYRNLPYVGYVEFV
ncbi:MAG: hypoxanthine phosphoribosyltransferase [Lachnospiraceae bacterium]|nr:hypoxanthine phosphoribosyltransferase [Lachnospiraceae bacterium]